MLSGRDLVRPTEWLPPQDSCTDSPLLFFLCGPPPSPVGCHISASSIILTPHLPKGVNQKLIRFVSSGSHSIGNIADRELIGRGLRSALFGNSQLVTLRGLLPEALVLQVPRAQGEGREAKSAQPPKGETEARRAPRAPRQVITRQCCGPESSCLELDCPGLQHVAPGW